MRCMADPVPFVPVELSAGDTATWTRIVPDRSPADGWAIGYSVVNATAAYSFGGTASGDGFLISVPAATTAAWAPGNYRLTEYVTKGAERYTLGTTPLRVLANLAGAVAGIDARSHARKVLDAIQTWLETRAPIAGTVRLGDREVQNYPIAELLALRDRYRREVANEEALASGSVMGSRLLMRL